MDTSKKTFLFNADWYEVLVDYPSEIRLEVYEAVIRYAVSGTLSELRPQAKMAFSFIKREIDFNQKKYDERVSNNRESGKKGGNPNFKKGKSNPYYSKGKEDNPTLPKITEDNPTLPKITLYDNDIDNDKKRKYIKEKFEAFRKSYPGTKKGLDVEFNNFVKKHKDYAEVIDLLPLAISEEIEWHNEKKNSGNWVPEYPHLTTWINQRRWESEFENINENEDKQQNGSRQVYIVPD